MNFRPDTHGLWEATAPPAPPTPTLVGDVNADVAIVGGGYTGLSAALHLAEAGCRPVVLEAVDVGFGGSGRNVGLVNAGLWVMPEELPRQLGEVHGERLLRQLGDAPALVFDLIERCNIDCEPVRNGTLHCAIGSKGLAEITARARQWQARGADVILHDAVAAERAIGSSVYNGALLDRRAGTVQPLAYVRGLADAAIRAGTTVYRGSPVTARDRIGQMWQLRTASGSVTAPWVLIATDAYSQAAAQNVALEQVMLPYFNMATQPLHDELRKSILPDGEGCWDTREILSSFRFDRDGRLVFGSVGALRLGGATVHKQWAERALARLFPQIDGVRFEHQWYGMIGMTDDAVPRLHLHGSNCVSISGYNGRGIAPGTTFGLDLANVVLGRKNIEELALPLTDLSVPRFRRARTAYYEAGAQVAHFVAQRLPHRKRTV